eukprot:CAMPEP_0175102504 /NCGR_PEP_ID=MMETSP0086_2-20121207/8483_1 /TAXON_ID=136419 /ORGANISM="Unknown Unknown, Strain D1" /LENGTH=126 /DNA_ID=CAMNT_0016377341 /DNA_START=78 /DNA_END=455 /DNA_ORIENTATION=-
MSGWISNTGPRQDGKVAMVKDLEIKSYCAEITTTGVNNQTSVSFPDESQYIGTTLPWLNLHLKHLGRFTTIVVELETEDGVSRKLSISNHNSVIKLEIENASLPLKLVEGWNKIVLNLADLCERIW